MIMKNSVKISTMLSINIASNKNIRGLVFHATGGGATK